MNTVSIDDIQERLRQLPPEKLSVIYDFVSYVADRCQDSAMFLYRAGTLSAAKIDQVTDAIIKIL